MRILALSSWWPFPADNGSRMRIASMLQALAAEHEIHLLVLSQEPVTEEQLKGARHICASAEAVRQPPWKLHPARQLASLWEIEPASVRASWSPTFDELVRARAAAERPDAVIAFQSGVAPYARRLQGIPRILEELEITNILDAYRTARGFRAARAWLTWAKLQSYVRWLLAGFEAGTVVSKRELQYVRRLAPASTALAVIPNGAQIDDMRALPPEPDTLIYPGALSYDANLDAMRYFTGDILPLIRAERPQVRLKITGKTTPEQRAALPSLEGVELTGYVPDIRTAVAQAWCEVVPLRQGGGTRLKVLEALALGTPVVSTLKGIEGLDLEHEKHVLVADTPAAFASATVRLLAQPELRERLAAAGRHAVEATYDWRKIGRQLNELLADVVARHRAGAGAALQSRKAT